ncbi:MAG: SMP-30/gluconolactonase/LRE family protein [Actinophytocola sp.]|uniref:SMP-30/gluconolactonase/LRE family protein n=1 Tax=Actinophytocola sp. TaxID=1872138 RepID=UPI0013274820|nr:SMP-30/gluconolactonase/LRE family protein [Actinophytocola sp.]MPZ82788.1 SMP-30/gluconolactonase/LRE family protein [Actinophytocola sp.]
MTRIEPVAGNRALVAESPTWDDRDNTLLWVDILRGEVHRFDPAGDRDRVVARLPVPVGSVVVRRSPGLVVAAGMGFAVLDESSGELSWLATVDRGDRMNDARCDPEGRLWGGTLTVAQRPGASGLYRLDPDHRLTTVLDDVALSNGLGWSPDGSRMYYADTVTERVDVFDYDLATGAASGRRTFVDLHEHPGRPDGLAVDAEGGVWVAMARGAAVRRFDPAGRLDEVLDMPTPGVTSCAFGGDGLGDLYVTTMCVGLSEADLVRYPQAGAVLRISDLGVSGLPAPRFAG